MFGQVINTFRGPRLIGVVPTFSEHCKVRSPFTIWSFAPGAYSETLKIPPHERPADRSTVVQHLEEDNNGMHISL